MTLAMVIIESSDGDYYESLMMVINNCTVITVTSAALDHTQNYTTMSIPQ